jgi:hypothetical protein
VLAAAAAAADILAIMTRLLHNMQMPSNPPHAQQLLASWVHYVTVLCADDRTAHSCRRLCFSVCLHARCCYLFTAAPLVAQLC